MSAAADTQISALYRSDWGRVVATLIRLTGDFTLAEEATQEAFEAAVAQVRKSGMPEHPRAWVIQTARHIAIDHLRRRQVLAGKLTTYAADLEEAAPPPKEALEIEDDRLRLMFTCCHPALALEAQVALTLRTLLGLDTEEIARSFLVPVPTMAQRLVRAKAKIKGAGIPYVVPGPAELPERLHAVLTVIYLVFNEGYAATRGPSLLRTDLSQEAIRLARLVRSLMVPVPHEVEALLALLLLQDSRRHARSNPAGDLILLEDQDRSRWDQDEIEEALALVSEARGADTGPFALQAALAAVHARAIRKEDTDWVEIVRLYDRLQGLDPSAVVALNRAVAVAMVEGPAAGLAEVNALAEDGVLSDYHLLHAARADFSRRLGALEDAEASYRRALALVGNESERRFLTRRLDEVQRARRQPT